ncbi:MAG: DUF4105 domain-containing protein [Alphaproteobacteria bacterium]|nr:DUF4105 domain-containing protein [Alphaproteobacteria bacterium]
MLNTRYLISFILAVLSLTAQSLAAEIVVHQPDSQPWNNIEWIKLLHYKNDSIGLIQSEKFYISDRGMIDPKAEFEAEQKTFNRKQDQRKCDFPARFKWLKKNHYVDGDLMNCTEYQQFIKDIQPQGITVLFTNSFMQNPASLFGHTLIRIDTARKGTQMLAHGANFGANSGTDSGIPFALKGLFGFYWGGYSLNPYWSIINHYNNIENRDIWEYKLNLTDEEMKTFVDHLYEMKYALVQYYFLNKNCSFMLLELLEAVRPALELTEGYEYWAIPLDTLKTLKEVDGLIGDVHYRPARYTKIMHQIEQMNPKEYKVLRESIKDQENYLENLSDDEKRNVLETLYQYYQYKYVAKEIELKAYRRNSFKILRQRSVLSKQEQDEKNYHEKDPVFAHHSFLFSLGTGINHHQSFESIVIRPAYTDLTDRTWGLLPGASVKVLESRWHYYNQKHRLVLQHFIPIHITSLVPTNRIFHQISYRTEVALRRIYDQNLQKQGYIGSLAFGLGQTFELHPSVWFYGLISAHGNYGGFIPHNQYTGLAPEIGVYNDFGGVRLINALENTFSSRHFGRVLQYKTKFSVDLTDQLSAQIGYTYNRYKYGRNNHEYGVDFKYYF